jgi:hypothetical protein
MALRVTSRYFYIYSKGVKKDCQMISLLKDLQYVCIGSHQMSKIGVHVVKDQRYLFNTVYVTDLETSRCHAPVS